MGHTEYFRTVRDLAPALGKRVRLELDGEQTELDKVLVERIDEPLLHLVRNSIDHGIETPAARAAAGKPEEGVLRLRAFHRGNQIVIEVEDDGAGIDPARVRDKAVESGLLSRQEADGLSDAEARELIFRPDLSTAGQVSEVSGRGVGMNVVWDTIITQLKGSIDVRSAVGRGTTLSLRLPLTLAIIQVLLLELSGETVAIPLEVVTRTLPYSERDVNLVCDREVLAVDDRQVPLVRLTDVLGLPGSADDRRHVILVDLLGRSWGLLCGRFVGKREVVIKSLGDLLEEVPGVAGATLVGDRCALILDVPALVGRAAQVGRPVARGAAEQGAAARPARILVVDDSAAARRSIRSLLEAAGYSVAEAVDGEEALALADRERFDLVSTGGPSALTRVLPRLRPDTSFSMVVVQHMPETFTAALAERLDAACPIPVKEAEDGDRPVPGRAFIARGDHHLELDRTGALRITDAPPVHGCRPAADVTLESAARSLGRRAVGLVMTGMGRDGTAGLAAVRAAGGRTFSQDEASCVIYGMPRSAVEAGVVDEVVVLDRIAARLVEVLG